MPSWRATPHSPRDLPEDTWQHAYSQEGTAYCSNPEKINAMCRQKYLRTSATGLRTVHPRFDMSPPQYEPPRGRGLLQLEDSHSRSRPPACSPGPPLFLEDGPAPYSPSTRMPSPPHDLRQFRTFHSRVQSSEPPSPNSEASMRPLQRSPSPQQSPTSDSRPHSPHPRLRLGCPMCEPGNSTLSWTKVGQGLSRFRRRTPFDRMRNEVALACASAKMGSTTTRAKAEKKSAGRKEVITSITGGAAKDDDVTVMKRLAAKAPSAAWGKRRPCQLFQSPSPCPRSPTYMGK